jgi:hypothetical protein
MQLRPISRAAAGMGDNRRLTLTGYYDLPKLFAQAAVEPRVKWIDALHCNGLLLD